ncbi:hypothetical protein P170DRAFT_430403 [Aspergillus steynii IBT 23096]|uniref:Zn(2)-C6 fungal-type domain-containing protein n=1 Tax=Aspergillus steynii IBT 23096 TaxID=1392250 RepID=A0A2I2FV86_9EURO|nr:uncharacterized protein P170DRAFT_430403 [Aspergillus steynii IBT 23096]PLB44521.1 hypothetical protein P170DRAFT_430403 [Aspergillus steynii IBT 23096]
MSSSRTTITKRACDGCKIRKIKCGGGNPCQACKNARIKCTYIRIQHPRGPQRLRSTTKYLIEQTQRGIEAQSAEQPEEVAETSDSYPTLEHSQAISAQGSRIPTNILASPLYIYHVRMYPVWPIVDVENVMSILQNTHDQNPEAYALATSVAAATIAQLRLEQNVQSNKSVSSEVFASECLKARSSSNYRSKANLDNVRTAFFLHVYYENQHPGGSESLLYLREAISLAQMMSLHREASYSGLPLEEQQIRRRVLWLLFVTERGVCILHKLPVVLKTNISTPEMDFNDEPQVLPAFLKLLNLFRLFEQSKMFDIIEDENPDLQSISEGDKSLDTRFFEFLEGKLQDGSILLDQISDVQKADLCVTRHWMRMILWKVSSKKPTSSSSDKSTSSSFPVMVAKELLNIVSQLPRTAIEAHGLGMELKLYEIANSLADAVMNMAMLPRAPIWDGESRPSSILARLHSILSTFRGGGNKELAEILYKKMAEAQVRSGPTLSPSLKAPHGPALSRPLSGPSKDGLREEGSADKDPSSSRSTPPGLHNSGISTTNWGDDLQTIGYEDLLQNSASIATDAQPDGYSHVTNPFSYKDMISPSLAGMGLTPPSFFPAYSYDPSYAILSTQAPPVLDDTRNIFSGISSLSPSFASGSMEMLIGDFISQIPDQYQPGSFMPMSDDVMDQNISNQSFMI